MSLLKPLLYFLCCCFPFYSLWAQPSSATIKKGKIKLSVYEAKITMQSGQKRKAWLYDISEDWVYLISKSQNLYRITVVQPTDSIATKDIKQLKLRHRKSYSKSFRAGVLAGAGTGILYGILVSNGSDLSFSPALWLIAAGTFGLAGGILALPFGGRATKKFKIDGDPGKYAAIFDQLNLYTIRTQLSDLEDD